MKKKTNYKTKICPGCSVGFTVWWRNRNKKYCTKKCAMRGKNNHRWKGDSEISYGALHKRVENQLGRPNKCSSCGKIGNVDLANISNQYKEDISDWEWLCRKCHMSKDGRLSNTQKRGLESRKRFEKPCIICGKVFMPSKMITKCCSPSCTGYYAHQNRKQKLHS